MITVAGSVRSPSGTTPEGSRSSTSTTTQKTSTSKSYAPKRETVRQAPARSTGKGPKITVRAGDTLSELAAEHGVRGGWQALYRANRGTISDADLIYVGQVIRLP